MHTVTLELSDAELQAIRTALVDYACLAFQQGRKCSAIGVPKHGRAWNAVEVAATSALSLMPRVASPRPGYPAPVI